jgi:site-specific recombinase XerD
LAAIGVPELQAWDTSLAASAPASRSRRLAAVRSMLAYGLRLGCLTIDPGRQIRVAKSTAGALRVLSESDVQRMIGAETDARSKVALRVLYVTGLRNAELCGLRRRDLVATKKGGEVRFVGKGSKIRTVAIPTAVWRELLDLMPGAKPEDPAITGRDGKPLHPRALHRLVRRAARRAGLGAVSPHWLRHAHASHALDHGAPPHVVQQTLGHASLATTTRYLHVRHGDSSGSYLPA